MRPHDDALGSSQELYEPSEAVDSIDDGHLHDSLVRSDDDDDYDDDELEDHAYTDDMSGRRKIEN